MWGELLHSTRDNDEDNLGGGDDPDDIPPDSNDDLPNTEKEQLSTWALLIHVTLLILTIWITYFFQRRQIKFMHETILSMVLGAFVGLIIRLSSGTGRLQTSMEFKSTYFFNVLLPPIILHSGYDLHERSFFRNFGRILTFALFGTFTSIFIVGTLEWILAKVGLGGNFSFLDSLIFGCILSSTDPVTVLAIFHQVRVDPNLYAVIFGESTLNDAVAIVLFSTLNNNNASFGFTSVFRLLGIFMAVFSGSVVVGVIVGLICALILKHTHLSEFPSLETCMVSLLAYGSYLFANACDLSGIVALMFCGITMKHYAYQGMSWQSRHTTRHMFKVLAQLAENFIFIYLAVTIFTSRDGFHPVLIFFTAIIVLVARYCSIYPLAYILNSLAWYRLKRRNPVIAISEHSSMAGSPVLMADDITPVRNLLPQQAAFLFPRGEFNMTNDTSQFMPASHQFMLWWAGLRGAVSFALSLEVRSATAGPFIQSTTLIIVVLTVVVLGGGTVKIVDLLGLERGAMGTGGPSASTDQLGQRKANNDIDEDGYHEEEFPWLTTSQRMLSFKFRQQQEDQQQRPEQHGEMQAPSGDDIESHGPSDERPTKHWFTSFDDMYLKPIFTKAQSLEGAGLQQPSWIPTPQHRQQHHSIPRFDTLE